MIVSDDSERVVWIDFDVAITYPDSSYIGDREHDWIEIETRQMTRNRVSPRIQNITRTTVRPHAHADRRKAHHTFPIMGNHGTVGGKIESTAGLEKGDIGSEVVGNLSRIVYAVGCLRFARSVHDPKRIDNIVIPATTWYLGHVDCFAIGDLKYSAFTLSPACPRTSVDRGSNSINSEAAHAGESALGAVEPLANVIFIFKFTLLRSTPFAIECGNVTEDGF
ncbi:conserved hypothetical protein [Histoplasma capsulatum H143]|uniref:Uncharacterized protein n=1 Tax=Ajellomyces capsulatus (strain H143) TaxID=544712 RepID=C6H8S2_AJECH|nr:conserved hypothetical protein [Histoplasma capsulatum H143]